MHSYEGLKETLPNMGLWLTGDNEANIPPRGESGMQMKARVMEAFRNQRYTCIITHGGVIAAIMENLFPE